MSGGSRLFARYAFAPNDLGYCGPAETATLFELAVTGNTDADVTAIAQGFSGAWPYLALLAELAGIDDPLDERVVRAYWTGSALLRNLDQRAFGVRLIDFLGSRAGHYWRHLSADLLPEATPTHGFHVFGVYPWSRLLGAASAQPLHVLDSCRIRWGQVQAVEAEQVVVRSRRLAWDGCQLELAPPAEERVRLSVGGRSFVDEPRPGQWLALHWDWVCDRLDSTEQAELEHWTGWQLAATNARLARERKAAG
ncbi:DUF6390 family protein [Jatrophihabitans sp.]|uniref:DUF6390 family protein n=1 Tax=Jatrophihabitans sp. TaxID=1932789 RepID=UPI002C1A3E14|nr:DUF6390 family protein [Jatrophihabitans sp.]